MSCNTNCECCKSTVVPLGNVGLVFNCCGTGTGGTGPIGGTGIDYSLEEQDTGRLWIDGKKIYQKTVACGVLPNNSATYVPHGVVGMAALIQLYGYAFDLKADGSKQFTMIPFPASGDGSLQISVQGDSLKLHAKTNWSTATENWVTILYTRDNA